MNHAFPHFGLAAALMYLPAKFRIRFLEPIDLSGLGPEDAEDLSLVQTIAEDVRARIQTELDSLVPRVRPSGSARVPARGMRPLRKTHACRALMAVGVTFGIAGCGDEDFKNEPRPAAAIELTGVIQQRGVSISPNREGAGPITITISNQTDQAHTVTLEGVSVQERVGPINPRDTATIQKTLKPGTYEVRAGSEEAVRKEIPPARLKIGPTRKNSSDKLLLP